MSKSKKIIDVFNTPDFKLYLRAVIELLKGNKRKFPAINEVVGYLDCERIDSFYVSLVIVCVHSFEMNQTTLETAKEIERCAQEGKDRAFMLEATEGSTVH